MRYKSLIDYGIAVLCEPCPAVKCTLTSEAYTLWHQGNLSLSDSSTDLSALPDWPARPEKPELLPPSRMPRRSSGEKGRFTLIHALAHIELNAIDLAWDIIARFGTDDRIDPTAFCTDWLQVAYEEATHFELLNNRLKDWGINYGDFPAHESLWGASFETRFELEARLAVVPMVLEARGLDVTPSMITQFERVNDTETATILKRIYTDEITHVEKGVFWFHHVVRLPPTERQHHFHELVKQYFKGPLKPPFNEQARSQAGLPEGYYKDYTAPTPATKPLNLYRYPPLLKKHQDAVWCLGNFDGVHKGHQRLIQSARECSTRTKRPWGVMTFEPHPRTFFKPDQPAFRLTTFRQKISLLRHYGVNLLFCMPFREKFSSLTPEEFAKQLLKDTLNVRHIFVGHDFYFGKGRLGKPEDLKAYGEKYGFGVTILDPQRDENGVRFASETVRKALRANDPSQAKDWLNHVWILEGYVQKGKQLGRTIGFPTANIPLKGQICPSYGVYAVDIWVGKRSDVNTDSPSFKGIMNIGIRPTVNGDNLPLCEVHIPDFSGDLYGQYLKIAPTRFIRGEQKFENLDHLKAQIQKDISELNS